jgi:hypothetical protein
MDKLERLAYWRSLAVDAGADPGSAPWTDEYRLFGYFDCFRPDGQGAERVFADVVCGDEILDRLRQVYACTKESFQTYMYFIVTRPAPATSEKLIELTTRHLENLRQIAQGFDKPELVELLEPVPQIVLTHEPEPDRRLPDFSSPGTHAYEVVGDWFRSLEPCPSDAQLLHEAFYSIACDYNIAQYLLWPLYRQSTEIVDPFAPYFDLWTHGARPWHGKPGLVTVYLKGES